MGYILINQGGVLSLGRRRSIYDISITLDHHEIKGFYYETGKKTDW
jgi:hypothetical protein